MKQPFCRWCGKPIKKLIRTVYIEPELKEHHTAQRFRRYIADPDGTIKTKADCQRHSNGQVVSVKRHWNPARRDLIRWFGEWDGESYVDEYFCSKTVCAVAMGYSAARHHDMSTKWYRDAVEAYDKGGNESNQKRELS